MKKIQILGPGCMKCKKLAENAEAGFYGFRHSCRRHYNYRLSFQYGFITGKE